MKKFLCDQMCGQLGKWLRVAGYDTVIIKHSEEDHILLKRAIHEQRYLITRDRDFLELDPGLKTVVYLSGESLDVWAEKLKGMGVNWLKAPFTRCLNCNTLLEKTPLPEVFPEGVPVDAKSYWLCPSCQQLFWLGSHTEDMMQRLRRWQGGPSITLGIGGDLMIGRLVNKQLSLSPPSYIWGDLHPVLGQTNLNLANLETTLTRSDKIVPKVFNFKADPEKVAALQEGPIHIVNIANNHILDFSEEGLFETLNTLDRAGIPHVGAGKTLQQAKKPCILERGGIKIGFLGCTDNEPTWRATSSKPGTFYLEVGDIQALEEPITSLKKQVDILILSIHWGPNMLRRPSRHFQSFAHELIDLGVDILHGHSAHVFQGVEVYQKGLILYDTGELVDDYAVDPYLRNDRSFFFVITLQKEGVISLRMIPTLISEFQVNIDPDPETLDEMDQLCREFQTIPERQGGELWIKL